MPSSFGSDARVMWRLLISILRAFMWVLSTLWFGVDCVYRVIVLVIRLRQILAQELPCPRGHSVATYGVFECACGSNHEGWVFGRCRVCGMSAGWTPCTECGLPVLNPLRR